MIPWELLDTAPVPGGGKLTLHCRAAEYSIRIDGEELMNSRRHESEKELARRVCALIVDRPRPRVLIGGLGMGYTLAAALGSLGETARVEVAEIVPAVVAWNQKTFGHLTGDPLGDPRTVVHQGDVFPLLQDARAHYDAVLLDVDNGPDALTRDRNERLYSLAGLSATRRALAASGVVGIWSAGPDRRFNLRLRQSGMEFEEVQASARGGGRGGSHTLWIGAWQPNAR